MTERIHPPALQPPLIRPAVPHADDPAAWLEAHYRHVWETRMRDQPFVNPALTVEAVGFRRLDGDWLGVVITPWFLNLVLVHGGGALWGDIPAGVRGYLILPCGTMPIFAADDPEIGPYQYCPLIASVDTLPDMATARFVAADAVKTVFCPPAPEPAELPATRAETPELSRRGFFHRLAGKRS